MKIKKGSRHIKVELNDTDYISASFATRSSSVGISWYVDYYVYITFGFIFFEVSLKFNIKKDEE